MPVVWRRHRPLTRQPTSISNLRVAERFREHLRIAAIGGLPVVYLHPHGTNGGRWQPWSVDGTPDVTAGPHGRAWNYAGGVEEGHSVAMGSNIYSDTTGPNIESDFRPFTLILNVARTGGSSGDFERVVKIQGDATTTHVQVLQQSGQMKFTHRDDGTHKGNLAHNDTQGVFKTYRYSKRANDTFSLYVDGAVETTTHSTAATAWGGTNPYECSLGYRNNGVGSQSADCQIVCMYFFHDDYGESGQDLGLYERGIRELDWNPWLLFEEPVTIMLPAAGAPINITGNDSDYALDIDQGTIQADVDIAIAGADTDLALDVDQGTIQSDIDITITGADADLALDIDQGTIQSDVDVNITGADTDLALDIDQGTVEVGADINITGSDTDLALDIDQGTVEVGNDINITGADANYALDIDSGTIQSDVDTNITGNDTDLALDVDQGTIATGLVITGNDTDLALDIDSGTVVVPITIAGADTDLALDVDAGNVALGSSIVGNDTDLALDIDSGTITADVNIVGADADLALDIDQGSVAVVQGETATIRYVRGAFGARTVPSAGGRSVPFDLAKAA